MFNKFQNEKIWKRILYTPSRDFVQSYDESM